MYHNFLSKFSSHNTENRRRGTLQCFGKKSSFINFYAVEGDIFFVLIIFCPTESKILVGEPSFVSENFGYRGKFWIREEGMYHNFLSKFLSHNTKKFVGQPFYVSENFGYRKIFMDKRRWVCITIFCQSLCLTDRKNSVGQLLCASEKIGYRKNLRIIRRLHYYLLIFFRSTVPKKFMLKHIGVSENFWFRKFFLIREEWFVTFFFQSFVSQYWKNS